MSIDECDVTITGFEVAEIDLILQATNQKSDPDNSFEVSEAATPVSGLGDIASFATAEHAAVVVMTTIGEIAWQVVFD